MSYSSDNTQFVNLEFTHTISFKDYITRILILGSTNNKYSSVSNEMDDSTKQYILDQIKCGNNGMIILETLREIYLEGRAPKQDATFMVHAMLCRAEDLNLRLKALEFLKEYRTISQLYSWKLAHTKAGTSKGFGRAVKRNLNEWILSKQPTDLAYQFTKYMSRGEWGFVDLLKCIHTRTGTGDDRTVSPKYCKNKQELPAQPIDLVLRYAIDGYDKMHNLAVKNNLTQDYTYRYLNAINSAKKCNVDIDEDIGQLLFLIDKFNLTREHLPTKSLTLLAIQNELLVDQDKTRVKMPMTALLRNLANLTRIGVFNDREILNLVLSHLQNTDVITKARIHPVNVLTAWFTYRTGCGKKSKHTWTPNPEIVKVLEEMFYLSFKNVKPTGKRICFLIDCSGSMASESLCEGVTNAEVAALLAMVFSRAEMNSRTPVQHSFYLFANGLKNVSDLIHPMASFNDVLYAVQRSDWTSTNISNGILNAMQFRRLYDGFVVITDNDVNSGIKPSIALNQYRTAMKLDTKLAVVATQMSNLSIADPTDNGMMDFCGFDSYGPKLLQEFFSGVTEVTEVTEVTLNE